jgi:MFS family permease
VGALIVARAIQGTGAAILPLGFGILRAQLPRGRVDFAISATAATAGVGTALGIVLAGPITSALDYHYLFWIPLLVSRESRSELQPLSPSQQLFRGSKPCLH